MSKPADAHASALRWVAAGRLLADASSHEFLAGFLEGLIRIMQEQHTGVHTITITIHQGRLTRVERCKKERIA